MNKLDLPDCYADMLRWTEEDGIIRATPKKPLSYTAHDVIEKAFKHAGGACVRNNGGYHFEWMTKPIAESDNAVSRAYRELEANGIFEEA